MANMFETMTKTPSGSVIGLISPVPAIVRATQPTPATETAASGMTIRTTRATAWRPSITFRADMKRIMTPWFMK